MKRFAPLVILITLVVLFAACTPAAAPDTGQSIEEEAGVEMADEQVLRYASPRILQTFDPAQEGGFGRFIIQHVWMPPFIADPEMNLTPGTCTSYDVSDDGRTYTLHVDPEAVWSDGSPFTAEDIKAWLDYVVTPENPSAFVPPKFSDIVGFEAVREGTTTELEGVSVLDEHTLTIQLKEANPTFPYKVLADYNLGTAKADVARANIEGWWLEDPLVTGPFKIESFDSDLGQFSFVPNENYWRSPPTLQRIEVTGVEDESTLGVMFENDEIDVALLLGEVGDQLARDYPDSLLEMDYTFSVYWLLNPSIPPTDDPKVRAALIHAIDHRRVVDAVFGDVKEPAPGPVVPSTQGFNPDVEAHDAFTFDPELARQELAESSYGSAENLPAIHVAAGTPQGDLVRGMEIVVEMWREHLGIEDVETKFWWGDWEQDEAGIRDVNVGGMLMTTLPDAATKVEFFSNPTGVLSRVGYQNDEVTELVESAFPLDRDSQEYVDLVRQAELAFLDDHVYKPYYLVSYNYYVKPWVKNLEATWYNSWYNITDVHIESH